ncbi:MAG TPA: protease pro-enzyme activation domain-containing protein [Candidatus Sulfotelmatobacter sp.]
MRVIQSLPIKLFFFLSLSTTVTALLAPMAAQESVSAQPSDSPRQVPLITRAVQENQLTVLKGNVHPLARPQFDLGTAPATLPMQRMLLVLKRSSEQESALRKFLDDQQDKHSPTYHKWLTPEQFGKQFGPAESDIQTITAWLQSHGFQVSPTKGRTVIEFSGSASQVQEAFHTAIHKYVVNGQQHWANSSDPQIPTALTAAVSGVLTLHNFVKSAQHSFSAQRISGKIRAGKHPQLTFPDGTHALAPQDYATIYNINPAYANGINGLGISIAVIGRSDILASDVFNFQSDFGIGSGGLNVIVNGPDPGDVQGDDVESTLDVTWSGAVATGAQIDFVTSASTNTTDGVDLSEVYIIENNLASIMTESYSSCEFGATQTDAQGVSALAEQAAAQGITYFVSTGDNGAEGCDDPSVEPASGSFPVSVNILASSPFTVAVGGTEFNENGQDSLYWSSSSQQFESVLSYIPENVWNESCITANCGLWSGSGGASTLFSKPSWQAGAGLNIPTDAMRDLPDVSLTAAGHDPYLLCWQSSCVPDSSGQFFIYFISGTSASAPSFAGIMALVDQQMENLNPPQGSRQGQANYVLYRLAASQVSTLPQCNGSKTTGLPASTCTFYDTTVGNNAVPGEPNYGVASALYQAGVGYDQATGLGSVNVANLVSNWNSVTFNPTTTTLALDQQTSIHGSAVQATVTVTPNSGTGVPTGDVAVLATMGPSISGQTSMGILTLNNGTVVGSTSELPGGGPYNVVAHYAGDATYAPSDSLSVLITVTPETSTTTMSGPFTQNQFGQWTVPFSTPQPFGTPVFVRADVKATSLNGVPTGAIIFTDTFGAIASGGSTTLNVEGDSSVQSFFFDAGNHSISATYGGDSSFTGSTSAQPVAFTIQPGFVSGLSGPSEVTITAPGLSGTTAITVLTSSAFSGTVNLACTGLPAEASCVFSPASVVATGTATTTPVNITITTTAAHTTSNFHQSPYYFAQWLATSGFALAGVFLVGLPRRRRGAILSGFILLLLLLIPGCGGGSSSSNRVVHQQDPGTPSGTYNVAVTVSSGSTTQSNGFTLSVQ